jgi:hypothetical protein
VFTDDFQRFEFACFYAVATSGAFVEMCCDEARLFFFFNEFKNVVFASFCAPPAGGA